MKRSIVLRSITVTLVLFIIGGYAAYESRNLINGPGLEIKEPTSGFTTENSVVEIVGKVKNISFISLNDRQITVDEAGWFKEKVILSSGYNIFKISVHDKFGREKERLVELILKEPNELVRK